MNLDAWERMMLLGREDVRAGIDAELEVTLAGQLDRRSDPRESLFR
jgi:hypothetical protein